MTKAPAHLHSDLDLGRCQCLDFGPDCASPASDSDIDKAMTVTMLRFWLCDDSPACDCDCANDPDMDPVFGGDSLASDDDDAAP